MGGPIGRVLIQRLSGTIWSKSGMQRVQGLPLGVCAGDQVRPTSGMTAMAGTVNHMHATPLIQHRSHCLQIKSLVAEVGGLTEVVKTLALKLGNEEAEQADAGLFPCARAAHQIEGGEEGRLHTQRGLCKRLLAVGRQCLEVSKQLEGLAGGQN